MHPYAQHLTNTVVIMDSWVIQYHVCLNFATLLFIWI